MLWSLQNHPSRRPIEKPTYNRLKECGLLKPFRGCRAGKAIKSRKDGGSFNIPSRITNREISIPTTNQEISIRYKTVSRNLVYLRKSNAPIQQTKEFGPSVLLANMMSLSPKIDELRCLANDTKPDLISLTETWIQDSSVCEHHLHIPGFNLILKNRNCGPHGGVGLYIKDSIKYKALTDIYHPTFEVLWACLRPKRLPRGFPCIVFGTVYHTKYPPGASDEAMLNYLKASLTTIEGLFPGCGILLSGDFNRLNISRLLLQFKLKQLVRVPTRGDSTLDLIITNMPQLYNKNQVQTFPPFGLSDHNVVLLPPTSRPPRDKSSRRTITRRDTRPSRKLELGRYLSSIDWSVLDNNTNCNDKLRLFTDLLKTGFDAIMPFKSFRLHVNDAPWVTAEFKNLIKQRQAAFAQGDQEQFRHLRNVVNRERKLCRSRYYSSKVADLKNVKPGKWWGEVKKIAGMTKSVGCDEIRSHIHIDGIEEKSAKNIADLINDALLEPMQGYQPLETLPSYDSDSEVPTLPVSSVHKALSALNPRKASGPDGIGNWLIKEYADILAEPVTNILNCSFAEQQLPSPWKFADVTPLPKQKPITNVSKHIRPISLTPSLSKVAEDFVVRMYVGPAILNIIDPNQFGAIPKSSTAQALISMTHEWSKATDGTGAAVRVILLDYKKAFDLIDHQILVKKILSLNMPPGVARWVCDFLMNRHQRTKLSKDCYSEWGKVPSGVPQGTKLGPWLFLLMINDLRPPNADSWKFVDDTTLGEVVDRDGVSHVHCAVEEVVTWSRDNKLVLNADKCKEMVIDFKKSKQPFDTICVNSINLERVSFAKILGLIFSNDLTWNRHVDMIITKGNKRMFFLTQLKRACIPVDDIVAFYCTCIRSVLEYCAPVFHHGLPNYLSEDIERVQKRALKILSPSMSYAASLKRFNLKTLKARREDHCRKLFSTILSNTTNQLRVLLPPENTSHYKLRTIRRFQRLNCKTNRFKDTFIPTMCNNF